MPGLRSTSARSFDDSRCDRTRDGLSLAADAEGGNPPGARLDRAVMMKLAAGRTRRRRVYPHGCAEERNTPPPASQAQGSGPESASSSGRNCCLQLRGPTPGWRLTADWSPSPAERRRRTDQGISKSGNRRLRKTMIELAWPPVASPAGLGVEPLVQARVGAAKGRTADRHRGAARKLLVASRRYATQGVVPEDACSGGTTRSMTGTPSTRQRWLNDSTHRAKPTRRLRGSGGGYRGDPLG